MTNPISDSKIRPFIPQENSYWCRKCKGHYGTYYYGEHQNSFCNNCNSCNHIIKTTPFTLLKKFLYSLSALVFFVLGLVCQILDIRSNPPMHYVIYAVMVFFAIVWFIAYKMRLAGLNEWLDWAKERGYEENAKNDGN